MIGVLDTMDWKYIVGVLGVLVGWVWSVYTWRKVQEAQRAQSEYSRKEGLYRELMRTLSAFYKGGPATGTASFLEQYRLSWLYAPDDVIQVLKDFVESQIVDPAEKSWSEADQLLKSAYRDKAGQEGIARLADAIRRDLFKTAGKSTNLTQADFGHYT